MPKEEATIERASNSLMVSKFLAVIRGQRMESELGTPAYLRR